MKRIAIVMLVLIACVHQTKESSPPAAVPQTPAAPPKSSAIYSGVYAENARESIFFPCGASPGTSGWWLRFKPGVNAERVRYQYSGAGFPTSSHFIVVRGVLSAPGFFGYGFQLQQLEVDSVLEIRDPTNGICPNAYNDSPKRFQGIGFVGRGIGAVASTADLKLTAIATKDGFVSVWDNNSGKRVTAYRFSEPYHPSTVPGVSMTFNPSGKLLAIGKDDGWIHVVTIPSGRLAWKLPHSSKSDTIGEPGRPGWATYGVFPVASLAFTSDGQRLASAGGNRAYVWSMTTGKQISKLLGPGVNRDIAPTQVVTRGNPPGIIGYTPNGILAVYAQEGGNPLFAVAAPKTERLSGLMKISPDERFIAIRESGDTVALWSTAEGRFTQRFSVPPFSLGDFAFSRDGERFAMPGSSSSVYVWSTSGGAPIAQLRAPHAGPFRMWFTPKGDSIVMTGLFDSTLVVSPLPPKGGETRNRIFTRARNPGKLAMLFGATRDSISPVQGAVIEVYGDSILQNRLAYAVSDVDGLFAIDSLTPAKIFVRARKIGFDAVRRIVDLAPGVTGVDLRMGHDSARFGIPPRTLR